MLDVDPLLTLLGRRGRTAVVRRLRSGVAPRSLRALAADAGVAHTVARRTVSELAALGAVEWTRSGRDAQVAWRPESPAAAWLATLTTPDLRGAVAARAATIMEGSGVAWSVWFEPGEWPADPEVPVRIALLWRAEEDEERALDASADILDALEAANLPRADVTTWREADVEEEAREGDPVAAAIVSGRAAGSG